MISYCTNYFDFFSPGRGKKSGGKHKEEVDQLTLQEEEDKGCWINTSPSGEKSCLKTDGTNILVPDIMVTTATDPFTRQVSLQMFYMRFKVYICLK